MPTPLLNLDSPYHKLFGTQPNYSKLRVYGYLHFMWLRQYNSHKLEDSLTPCIFIGYSPTQSVYLCLQPNTGRINVSRHVRFDEIVFAFSSTPPLTQTATPEPTTNPNQQPITKIPIHQPTPSAPLLEPMGSSSSDSHLQVHVSSPSLRNTSSNEQVSNHSPSISTNIQVSENHDSTQISFFNIGSICSNTACRTCSITACHTCSSPSSNKQSPDEVQMEELDQQNRIPSKKIQLLCLHKYRLNQATSLNLYAIKY